MHSALPTQERFQPRRTSRVQRAKMRLDRYVRYKTKNALLARAVALVCTLTFVYQLLFAGRGGARPEMIIDPTTDIPNFYFYDLSRQTQSAQLSSQKTERVLVCMPLRNAEPVLDTMFEHLHNLTYPHELIDVAFLVSDCDDNTGPVLETLAQVALDSWPEQDRFRSIDIYYRDFGAVIGQGFDDRHSVAVQAARRKLMGRARNWLLSAALQPEHSWVYWRDADIESSPNTLIEDLMKFNKDVIVPNVWRPLPKWLGGQQPYDLNAWMESPAALDLAKTLKEDDVIVEGYAEYPTWRVHLAYLRADDGNGNINEVLDLDGIGGVSILCKASVFRAGVHFPGFAFENHAETEGFGKMARRMGYQVAGLPQYTIWHRYEPSEDDLIEMENRKAKGLSID